MLGKTIKEYTVNLKSADEDGNSFIEFKNLRKARKKALAEYRKNNLYSFLNYKGVPLSL